MADASSDHRTHDLEAIAALADDRGASADGRPGTTPECPACAALLDDLRRLSRADATLLVPARTRDFRLDPAQAARLAAMGPEPERGPGRLGGEMTTPAADHAAHDPELVAAHLDGRLAPEDLERVEHPLPDPLTFEDHPLVVPAGEQLDRAAPPRVRHKIG